ncbi:hypothetical protein HK102_013566 [Quaeritorhiza haematococci]|nr:hypothetical protein HK102_013566 [Quaeritorhiza haematococci]
MAHQNNINLKPLSQAQVKASFDDLALRCLHHFFFYCTTVARLSSPPVDMDALLFGIDDLLSHSCHIVAFLDEVAVRAEHNVKEAEGGGNSTSTKQGVVEQRKGNRAPSSAVEVVAVPVRTPPEHKTKTPTWNGTNSPLVPALPAEIVSLIFSYVLGDGPDLRFEPISPSDLVPDTRLNCLLVNKLWSVEGRKIISLWRNVHLSDSEMMYRFATSRLWMEPSIVFTSLRRLDICCNEPSRIWIRIVSHLQFFPNLRSLCLTEVTHLRDLIPLFWQALPSLQDLKLCQYRSAQDEQEDEQQLIPWDWSLPSPNDHQFACTFFSRLKVLHLECDMGFDVDECPAFVDMAHEGLRAIHFPKAVPDHLVARFFARCSRELSVVDISMPQLSLSTLEVFTATCTGVRALGMMDPCDDVDADGLASFLEVRGKGLVALDLNLGAQTWSIDSYGGVIQSLINNCPSLERLCVAFRDSQFKEDSLEVVTKRGGTIKNLELSLPWAEQILTDSDDLIRLISDCCPNLEELHLPDLVNIHVPGTEGQSESDSNNEKMSATDVREETLAKLVDQCKDLYVLTVSDDFDWSRFSDPELKAKVHKMTDVLGGLEKYYNYRFYEGRSFEYY